MIKNIDRFEDAEGFARSFSRDRCFCDPMLSNEIQFKQNLIKSIQNPDSYNTFGVYENEKIIGLFSFLRIPEESYLEMIVGLSKEKSAYDEMMDYLAKQYAGYGADFVYNPRNYLLGEVLRQNGAEFYPEQIKMKLCEPILPHSDLTVAPYSDDFKAGYMALHDDADRYWTSEKVIAAPERFRVLLAIHEGEVVGYIDVTNCFDENEPFDFFVAEPYRRKGFGKALLSKAIELNKPNKMMLLVDADNIPAINLYKSFGFKPDEFGGSITAHLKIMPSTVNRLQRQFTEIKRTRI